MAGTQCLLKIVHDLLKRIDLKRKRRILSDSGHLSNTACGDFVRELVGGGAEHILLAHLSPENNTPELAYLTVQTALTRAGFREGEDFSLRVAARDRPVALSDDI